MPDAPGQAWPWGGFRVALLALLYALLGWGGAQLAIAPGYASPVFPAAGLALVAVLVGGVRYLPGVWLGSFALNLWLGSHAGGQGLVSQGVAASVAAGATVQAALGAWWVRRWQADAWPRLEREHETFVFMFWGGLLACLVSASVSVSVLVGWGVIAREEVLFTWWNWYLGDALGVMIFAPLSLCFWPGGPAIWRQRRQRIAAPMLLTLGVTGLMFYGASRWEADVSTRRLANDGQTIADRISEHLIRQREVLASVRNFAVASPDFTFAQFERFTRHALQDNPDISALSFNDFVTREGRAGYEAAMGRHSPTGAFKLTERDAQGRLVTAARRAQHVAVRYIVPLEHNRPAVGFDIFSEPVRRAAIEKALAQGGLSITAPIRLVQDSEQRVGLLELLPVYRREPEVAQVPMARPLGFAVGVLTVDRMVNTALVNAIAPGLVVQLRDPQAPASSQLLYRSDGDALKLSALTPAEVAWSTRLSVADRSWELALARGRTYGEHVRPWLAWAVGAAGLLFAALLQVLALGMTGRTAVMQRKNDELRASEGRYVQLFNESPLPTWLYDSQTGRFLMVNDRAVAHYGWSREQWLGMRRSDLLAPGAQEAKAPRAAEDDSAVHGIEQAHVRQDGGRIDVKINSSPAFYGAIAARLEVVEDITEEKQTRTRLLLADKVLGSSSEGIVLTDVQGQVVSVNPAFTRITGYSSDEILGQNLRILQSGRQSPAFYRQMWQAVQLERQWQGEVWNRRKNGEVYPEWLTISAVLDETGKVAHYLGAFSDITAQKQAREKIDFLAFHDPLTGLPNRVLGKDRLNHALAHNQRHHGHLAVLYMDLDKFKYVNDTHGHSMGDALLKAVAGRLELNLRAEDLICRLSGDEFMAVLQGLHNRQAVARVCEKILEGVALPFELDGMRLNISFSIGVAMLPEDGHDAETLMRNADTALYEAKQSGRNTYRFFDQQMNADVLHFVQTRDALRLALERQEFELHYQPQVDFSSGKVVGVEALIRWHRPGHGMVPPALFIPAAEESGLIVPIGQWVLHQACRQAAAWHAEGFTDLVVAVNLSAVQFLHGQMEDDVFAALRESGMEPTRLELELTESMLVQDVNAVMDAVRRFKSRGIQLSIDDFGTGYSSLAYLKRFNVDKLKIDRSFVMDILRDEEDRAIVQAVVQLAHSLNLKAIAEGVEDEATVQVLRGLGCDEGQGYVFAKPLTAPALGHWLRSRQAVG